MILLLSFDQYTRTQQQYIIIDFTTTSHQRDIYSNDTVRILYCTVNRMMEEGVQYVGEYSSTVPL